MVRIQKAVILSVALPREEEALSLRASSDIGRMKTVRKRENETGRTSRAESEAAVAAMQAKPKEERHATANAELGPRPNYDMGAVANGAPPQTTIWGLPRTFGPAGVQSMLNIGCPRVLLQCRIGAGMDGGRGRAVSARAE